MQYSSLPSDMWCWPDFADLTPEDRYYLLYLHTNPHVTITGCYALPRRIAAAESGYNEETSDRILSRLVEAGGWIQIDSATREVLLLRWPEINPGWFIKNSNTYKSLVKSVPKIKCDKLRAVVQSWLLSDTPLEGLTSPLQAPYKHPASITHHHHNTSPHNTPPSPSLDGEGGNGGGKAPKKDITTLLINIPLHDQAKLIPKIKDCLTAGHSVHACHQAIDSARNGASPGRDWIGLAHHKLEELAGAEVQSIKNAKTEDRAEPTPDLGQAFFEFVQNQK